MFCQAHFIALPDIIPRVLPTYDSILTPPGLVICFFLRQNPANYIKVRAAQCVTANFILPVPPYRFMHRPPFDFPVRKSPVALSAFLSN